LPVTSARRKRRKPPPRYTEGGREEGRETGRQEGKEREGERDEYDVHTSCVEILTRLYLFIQHLNPSPSFPPYRPPSLHTYMGHAGLPPARQKDIHSNKCRRRTWLLGERGEGREGRREGEENEEGALVRKTKKEEEPDRPPCPH